MPGDDPRDFGRPKSRPLSAIPHDPDATPVEGTRVAETLRGEVAGLREDLRLNREDLRVHSETDVRELQALRTEQVVQSGHISDIRVETAKQTVMIQHLYDANRQHVAAQQTEVRERTARWWDIVKAVLAVGGGVVTGWVLYHLAH